VCGLGQLQPYELSHLGLIGTPSRRIAGRSPWHIDGSHWEAQEGLSVPHDLQLVGAVTGRTACWRSEPFSGPYATPGASCQGSGRRWCERPLERKEVGSGAEM
jgi:hypothetical protein